MEKQGKVAIWVGNFDSKHKFKDFMRENYNEDGDLNSFFMDPPLAPVSDGCRIE